MKNLGHQVRFRFHEFLGSVRAAVDWIDHGNIRSQALEDLASEFNLELIPCWEQFKTIPSQTGRFKQTLGLASMIFSTNADRFKWVFDQFDRVQDNCLA